MGLMATIGVFDGVHCGHRDVLRQLRKAAAEVGLQPAIVTFTRHPLDTIKPEIAPPLLMSAEERLAMLHRQPGIKVIELEFTPELRQLRADEFMRLLRDEYGVEALFMGYDHHFGSDCIRDPQTYREIAERLGMRIVRGEECRKPDVQKISSSAIRRALQSGDVTAAAEMLGRPYMIGGIVEHGRQLGRQIGYPTANIRPDDTRRLIPAPGVYACRIVTPDNAVRDAMVNIGVRPTIESEGTQTIEAHIFDFDKDVYGAHVYLQFIARLRDEKKFDSVEQLRRQLVTDAENARHLSSNLTF